MKVLKTPKLKYFFTIYILSGLSDRTTNVIIYWGTKCNEASSSLIGAGETFLAEYLGAVGLSLPPGLFKVVSVLNSSFATSLIQSRTSVTFAQTSA